jgi:uncharacterized membrane protein
MLGVIVSLVAALLGALVAVSFGASTTTAVVVAGIVFLLLNVFLAMVTQRALFKFVGTVPARFPSPSGGG